MYKVDKSSTRRRPGNRPGVAGVGRRRPSGDGGDMEVLDAMHVRQRKGKPFSLFGCDKFIDIDGMNGLIARSMATTVAKRLPSLR
jgi:hypothetical protein